MVIQRRGTPTNIVLKAKHSVLGSLSAWTDNDDEEDKKEAKPESDAYFKLEQEEGIESPPAWKVHFSSFLSDSDSTQLNIFIGSVIIVNAIVIGLETDFGRGQFMILEHIFNAIFFAEMALRIGHKRLQYFHEPWNLFDFTLVCTGTLDLWILPLMHSSMLVHGFTSLRILRVIRILRLLRVLRVIRLFRMFSQLNLIVKAFAKAFQVVLVVSVLILILNYACAIVLTQTVGHDAKEWKEDAEQIKIWFGTIPDSMRTLFFVMTLADWDVYPMTVTKVLPALPVFALFIAYIVIASYTMVSLITAIISESLIAAATDYRQRKLINFEDSRSTIQGELMEYLNEMLEDEIEEGGGFVEAADLKQAMRGDQELFGKLRSIRINMNDKACGKLIDSMSSGGKDPISIENFVDRVCNLSGEAKACDLANAKHIALQGKQIAVDCQRRVEKVEEALDAISSKLDTLLQSR